MSTTKSRRNRGKVSHCVGGFQADLSHHFKLKCSAARSKGDNFWLLFSPCSEKLSGFNHKKPGKSLPPGSPFACKALGFPNNTSTNKYFHRAYYWHSGSWLTLKLKRKLLTRIYLQRTKSYSFCCMRRWVLRTGPKDSHCIDLRTLHMLCG